MRRFLRCLGRIPAFPGDAFGQLAKLLVQGHGLLLAQVFDIHERVSRSVHCRDEFIELEMDCQRILVLGALDEEDHEESDNGRAGVDDELPGVGKMEKRSGDEPDQDDKKSQDERQRTAGAGLKRCDLAVKT